jgi:hypothetical protein
MKMKIFNAFVLLIAVFLFSSTTFSQTPKSAREYFERGKKLYDEGKHWAAYRNIGKIKEADEKRAAEICKLK